MKKEKKKEKKKREKKKAWDLGHEPSPLHIRRLQS